MPSTRSTAPADLRAHLLDVASRLFYERGVRAVGVDLVVARAGVAKTSLYRYFPTKDDLIVAFLEREDDDFWAVWDEVAVRHAHEPLAELDAHLHWIGARLERANYRGCPQLNVAAEFAEPSHPARDVARAHMQALQARLTALATRLGAAHPESLGAQLTLLINGAFASASSVPPAAAKDALISAGRALVANAPRRGSGSSALSGSHSS